MTADQPPAPRAAARRVRGGAVRRVRRGAGWRARRQQSSGEGVTTRLGVVIIALGIALLVLRAIGVVDTEVADIASVLAIVLGALAVAIDGEAADGA